MHCGLRSLKVEFIANPPTIIAIINCTKLVFDGFDHNTKFMTFHERKWYDYRRVIISWPMLFNIIFYL